MRGHAVVVVVVVGILCAHVCVRMCAGGGCQHAARGSGAVLDDGGQAYPSFVDVRSIADK